MKIKIFVPKKSSILIPKSLLTNFKIFKKQLDLSIIAYEDYKEAQRHNAPLYSLEPKGELMTTDEFASLVLDHSKNKAFLIGQKLGIPPEILNQSKKVLSLSKMTLPSWLAATVLIEQIFRSFCIVNNHPYARA